MMRKLFVGAVSTLVILGFSATADTALAAKKAKKSAAVAAAPKCAPPLVAACTARVKGKCTTWTCTPFVFAPLMPR